MAKSNCCGDINFVYGILRVRVVDYVAMKIWHISDTHGHHDLLTEPDDIDCIILSGDASNSRCPYNNESQLRESITWLSATRARYKIFIAGNHDTSIEKGLVTKDNFTAAGIIYLFNDSVTIEGFNIWGSPHCPQFGGWAFMKNRSKLHSVWVEIPDDTDIVVTHTPPKGILDISYSKGHMLESCGCSALNKRMLKLQPLAHLFGHIHNCEGVINAGVLKLSAYDTQFSNGSVVTDGKFGKLSSNGNILEVYK